MARFQSSLAIAKELIDFEAHTDDPPSKSDEALAQGLRGGAAVLMVAAFEQFLRDMFEERMSILSQIPIRRPFDQLPVRIRRTSLVGTLNRAIRPPPYLSPKPDVIAATLAAGALVTQRTIDPGSFSDPGGNPGSAVVKSMFKSAALGEIWNRIQPGFYMAWGKTEAHTFVPDKLDEVVNRRHKVAHTADALSISRVQLQEAPRFLEIVATELDTVLEAHLENVMNGKVK